jgi:hypothetical protein
MFLQPAQRQGIGSRLLADERGRQTNKPVRLGVVKINPAVRLYQRFGFVITSEDDFKFIMERRSVTCAAARFICEARITDQRCPAVLAWKFANGWHWFGPQRAAENAAWPQYIGVVPAGFTQRSKGTGRYDNRLDHLIGANRAGGPCRGHSSQRAGLTGPAARRTLCR